ncbi:tetratricopeptide repeat protein [Patulibacter defluvii]|uniref:tetratricopeptide repeat protein n=1 Tax=Patulibacter defluvii TaxID=3095358 RepID=UPI002A74A011|nr:tetratricopeptide repeat protein [Patulibacter sp. DM4]
MSDDWDARVAAVWAAAGDRDEAAVVADLLALVDERPAGDAAALYEHASALDFAGREAEAEPLYRQALAAGLDDERRPRAQIQLASTLRNLGRPAAAVELLERAIAAAPDDDLAPARAAFLALALVDDRRPAAAVAAALAALAPHVPEYGGAVARYAAALRD